MYHEEDMHQEKGSYRGKEGEETLAKLSVTPAIRKDTSVTIALSTCGTNEAKDEKP